MTRPPLRRSDTRPAPDRLADGEPITVPIEDSIDLHAFAPADIRAVVDDYLEAAWEAGFPIVRLIHGRGAGVQRGLVQATLERHPRVETFWDAPESHLGATLARLTARPARS